MLKTITMLAVCTAAAFTAGSARTVYSIPQTALPIGHSLKVTPDVANIWSWHERITLPNPGSGSSTVSTQVFVDINGDNVMDTVNPHVRVVITDMQVDADRTQLASAGSFTSFLSGVLRDSSGARWDLTPATSAGDNVNRWTKPTAYSLNTPLVLPVGSDLWVDLTVLGIPASVDIHLIGRVVNL